VKMRGIAEMTGGDPEAQRIYAYLLGEGSEEERAAFQLRIFNEEALFAQVCDAENDLIDALARGHLLPAEAERVRRLLHDSSQDARNTVAAALAERERRGRPASMWRQWGALAACLVLGSLCALLLVSNHRLRSELARSASHTAESGVFSVTLYPGVVRGEQSRVLLEPPATARFLAIHLALRDAGGYHRYRADLAPEPGQPLITEVVPRGGNDVQLTVPREILPAGQYEIVIYGLRAGRVEPLDSYHFSLR